jgi:hypothetical protein
MRCSSTRISAQQVAQFRDGGFAPRVGEAQDLDFQPRYPGAGLGRQRIQAPDLAGQLGFLALQGQQPRGFHEPPVEKALHIGQFCGDQLHLAVQ